MIILMLCSDINKGNLVDLVIDLQFKKPYFLLSQREKQMSDVELPPITVPQKLQVHAKLESGQDSLSNASRNIIQQDIEMVQSEIKRLRNFSDSLSTVVRKIASSGSESSTSIDQLSKQSKQLEDQIQAYKKVIQQSTQRQIQKAIEANKKQYIAKWEERISIASEVNIDVLKDVDIDDKKSVANQLFKWIVVAIYHQPENKYYFPNFKEQLFEKDDGKDFKQRLGKINAATSREQEILKIKDFLNKYNNILQAEQLVQLKQLPKQAAKFKKVAQIFIECNEIARKTAELQKSIEMDKQNSIKRDQEGMKWKAKHQAVQERLQVVQQYMQTIGVIEKELQSKVKINETKLTMAQQFLSTLKKGAQIPREQMEKYATL